MAHTIDEDTKKIVKAIVHGDQKRQSRRRAGKHTDFDRKAAEAIKAAKRELPLEGTDPEVRRHIIDKLYTSLLYNTPWELLGETYCCRRLFYEYRKEFRGCYCVAGIDLSRTTDLTAASLIIEKDGKNYVITKFFMPRERFKVAINEENVPYNIFEQQGFLKIS